MFPVRLMLSLKKIKNSMLVNIILRQKTSGSLRHYFFSSGHVESILLLTRCAKRDKQADFTTIYSLFDKNKKQAAMFFVMKSIAALLLPAKRKNK